MRLSSQVLVIMLARVLAVEMLCCVMTFAFVLPPLRRRLQHLRQHLREATLRAAPRCRACLGCGLLCGGGRRWRDAADDAGAAQQAWLQRKAKLQEHLSKVMQVRLSGTPPNACTAPGASHLSLPLGASGPPSGAHAPLPLVLLRRRSGSSSMRTASPRCSCASRCCARTLL